MLVECPSCDALNVWEPGGRCEDCGSSLGGAPLEDEDDED
jgi:hypothetical protein